MRNILLISALFLAGCFGYQPFYSLETANASIGSVKMLNVNYNTGERRIAQKVRQRLIRSFPSTTADYKINIKIEETTGDLAVKRDATVERSQITLSAKVEIIEEANDSIIFKTELSASTAYNVEDTPYSTDAGKVFARQAAAKRLADEITKVVRLRLEASNKVKTK